MLAEVERCRPDVEALCRRFRVQRLELFGSAARDTSPVPVQDLDFLVEFEPPTGRGYADRFFGLLEALESLFGRPVDLVIPSAVRNPYFRESLDKTRVVLYAG